ncbi:MAG TPA: hypothetical protein VFJ43_17860 [Bacteroidia bacterium]|nr:hypothetical protein [Bacteroidia bacterium]
MKKFLNSIFLSAILISFVSCSSDSAPDKKTDSAVADTASGKKIIQTDSGRIEIEIAKGSNEGKAALYDANGKLLQTGMYINDKPAGAWIKYDASGNIISAEHYSSGKPLMQLDKNDFVFREWNNGKIGLKFKVPKDWTERSSPNPALLVSFEKPVKDTTVHMKPNFTVAKATLGSGENLEILAKRQIDMMHQYYDRVEPPIDENNIAVDSCDAFRRYGMYYSGNEKFGYLNVIIIKNTDVWFFSCVAQNNANAEFLKYQGVFQEILESIQRVK